jgi:hypothetical protein
VESGIRVVHEPIAQAEPLVQRHTDAGRQRRLDGSAEILLRVRTFRGCYVRTLLCLVLLAIADPAPAAGVPGRVEIAYRVSVGALTIGQGRDVLEHDGRKYKVVSTSRTAGVAGALYPLEIVRESGGRVTTQGLRPDSFEEIRNGKLKRRVQFDWNRKQAVLFDGVTERTVPLPENTWDQLRLQLCLRGIGARGAAGAGQPPGCRGGRAAARDQPPASPRAGWGSAAGAKLHSAVHRVLAQ